MKNRLHEYCQNCWDKSNCKNCAIKETKNYIKKLKEENKLFKSKEIPMKAIKKHYEDEGEPEYIKVVCPKGCRVQVGSYYNYCPHCGQAIDGSEQV